ncbi:MAG: O-antigen ligase family protein [Bacilli bacterium]|nr:O-antigen ligase family protein [Bacilli bacterium]
MKKYLIYILLFMQPVIDIFASFQIRYFNNIPSISAIIRLAILLVMVLYILFKKNKKDYILLLITFIFFIISAIHFHSISAVLNVVKILFLPISILFFVRYDKDINKNMIVYVYVTYLLLVIVPTLLGLNFNVYAPDEAKKASLGLFYGGNELSAILLGYLPIVLVYSKEYKLYERIILYILILLSFTFIGTKTLFLGAILVLLIMFIYKIINKSIKLNKYAIVITIGILIVGAVILPFTPIAKNLKITLDYYNIHSIKDVNISTIDNVIYSKRLTYASNLMDDYGKQDLRHRLLGVGTITIKDSEIDIIDMIYIIGIVGIIFYLLVMIFIVKDNKLHNVYLLSFILFILMSCFSGHIFMKPNVLIYIGLLFNLNNKIKDR